MPDNIKLKAGTGDDLEIYHDGQHSRIHNSTGNLSCKSAAYYFNNAAGTENMLDIVQNSAVSLYYDSSKKLETQANGVDITGNLFLTDTTTGNNGRIKLGNSADFQIYHDGANSWLRNETGELRTRADDFRVMNNAANHTQLYCNAGAQVELYYDNAKKFETGIGGEYGSFTASNGANGWDGMAVGGSNIVFMGNSSSAGIWNDADNEWMIKCNRNSGTILQWNGSDKFETKSTGAQVHGSLIATNNIQVNDGKYLYAGNSGDLAITHSGSHAFISNQTGDLSIQSDGNFKLERKDGGEDYIHCAQDGQVELHYNGSVTAETTSWGFAVGGSPNGTAVGGLSNYALYAGFGLNSSSTFGGVVMGSGPNGNSPFVAASKAGNGTGLNLGLRTNGSVRLLIQNNGNIGAPSGSNIYYASDQRLKKNVTPLDKGLEAIKALKPVSFNWIDGFCDVEKDPLYGFIAQEVQTVDSNLVSPFGDDVEIGDDPNNPDQVITDPLRVNEKFIIPMLVKAVQELSAKVAALEAK